MILRLFLEEAAKRTSRLWSLEQVSAVRDDVTADNVMYAVAGFDQLVAGTSTLFRWVEALQNGGANINRMGAVPRQDVFKMPMLHRAGVALEISVAFNTNTNTVVYEVDAWGWVWDAPAYRSADGPRKPW